MTKEEELKQEMFEEWLWDKWEEEIHNQAIKEVESKHSLWKQLCGLRFEIRERMEQLFKTKLKEMKAK